MATDYASGYTPTPDREERRPNPIIGGIFNPPPLEQLSGSIAGGGTYASRKPYRSRYTSRLLGRQASTGGLADLQMALIEVGLLDADEVIFGYADDATSDAMDTILGIANQQGMTWQDVLSQAMATGPGSLGGGGAGGGAGGAGSVRPQIVLPNREELRADIDDATFARTGVRYDPGVLDHMADAAIDHARDLQEQEFRSRNATEVESGQSLESFVEAQIEEQNPGAVMSHDVAEKAASWFDAIRSPV